MSIDFKDEYATLRQEMLERFERIHDTVKYGVGAFIAFLSYYYVHPNFDNFIALTLLQLIITLVGISVLRLYQSIYVVGTYIEIRIEKNSEAKWHQMSRGIDKNQEDKSTLRERLPFPIGQRWGADSAQSAILLIFLMFIGFGVVALKTNTWLELWPSCFAQCLLFAFILVFVLCNVFVFCQLWWGMEKFKNNTFEKWENYSNSFDVEEHTEPSDSKVEGE